MHLRRYAAIAAIFGILAAQPASAVTPAYRARAGASYVAAVQNQDGSFPGFSPIGSTADAVTALVAARRQPGAIADALAYLESASADVDTVGEKAKVVLALVAAGRDPRSFAGRDLVAEITAGETSEGQYSAFTPEDPFDGEVTDQTLAILALAGAPGVDPSSSSLTWLLAAQCPDGGWQHPGPQTDAEDRHCFTGDANTDFFRSDTNTTAYAVMAAAAHPDAAPFRVNPVRFFRAIRDDVKGGWGYDWSLTLTDTNSTALAIQAFVALGRDLPAGAMRALNRLQFPICGARTRAGAFSIGWESDGDRYVRKPRDPGATIGAIPALLRAPFPIGPASVSARRFDPPACPR